MDIKKEYERWLVNATADTDVADVSGGRKSPFRAG